MNRQPVTSSAETAARYQAARHRKDSRGATAPVYATDGIEIPRRKRRILLDLAPETVERMRDLLCDAAHRDPSIDRLLVEALERAR